MRTGKALRLEAQFYVRELKEKVSDYKELEDRMIELCKNGPDWWFGDPTPVIVARLYKMAKAERGTLWSVPVDRTVDVGTGVEAGWFSGLEFLWLDLRLRLRRVYRKAHRTLTATLLHYLGRVAFRVEYSRRYLLAYYRDVFVLPQIQGLDLTGVEHVQNEVNELMSLRKSQQELQSVPVLYYRGPDPHRCSTRRRRLCRVHRRSRVR